MRFVTVALLTLFLTVPAWAQQGAASGVSKTFGNGICREKIPCPGDENSLSTAALAASADGCVAQGFGMSRPSGIFDGISGLDGNNCLTVTPEAVAAGMSPQCCMIVLPDSSCAFQCLLVAH